MQLKLWFLKHFELIEMKVAFLFASLIGEERNFFLLGGGLRARSGR